MKNSLKITINMLLLLCAVYTTQAINLKVADMSRWVITQVPGGRDTVEGARKVADVATKGTQFLSDSVQDTLCTPVCKAGRFLDPSWGIFSEKDLKIMARTCQKSCDRTSNPKAAKILEDILDKEKESKEKTEADEADKENESKDISYFM